MSFSLEIPAAIEGFTFIYALVDPRTNLIRYVGKSDRPKMRLLGHIEDTYGKPGSNKWKVLWIKELLTAGMSPLLVVLSQVSREHWKEHERMWIKRLRKGGAPLTNQADGGEDPPKAKEGWKPHVPPSSKNRSGVKGVCQDSGTRWKAYCNVGKIQYSLGSFRTRGEAITERRKWERGEIDVSTLERRRLGDRRNKSGYNGVCLHNGFWRSYITIDGNQVTLGWFDTPEEAHQCRQAAEKGDFSLSEAYKNSERRMSRRNSSGVKGVSYMPSRDRWQAYFRPPFGKTRSLGKFKTFDEAVSARKAAEDQYAATTT